MGYFPAKSAVSQPICKGGDTHGRRIWAKSVSAEWLPETLHGVVFLATAAMAGSITSNFHTPSVTAFGIGREPDKYSTSAQKLPGYTHKCLRLLHLWHVPPVVQHHRLGV
jgi:hypothetical protein